ncbi:MAG: hypothetical protein ACPGUV_04280 [Polyangiales bacterium]
MQSRAMRNMQAAVDMLELAEQILRQNLRRRHPDMDEAAIEQAVRDWYAHRPGAQWGDGVGTPRIVASS